MRRSIASLLAFVLLGASTLAAQDAEGAKRPLTLDDYGTWSRINQVTLSPDGMWLAHAQQPNDGDATFYVQSIDGDEVFEGLNGSGAAFSNDGRWVGFLSSPAEDEAEKLRKAKKPVHRTLHLIDLRSGDRTEESSIRSFSFSEDGRFWPKAEVRTHLNSSAKRVC